MEVEAYLGSQDPASHAFRGPTPRNQIMFEEGGHAYVYFTYGCHFCMNVVTGEAGTPSAVLIRALEPLQGIETMKRRRKNSDLLNLTSGPGKLCQALMIKREHNGLRLNSKKLWISDEQGSKKTPYASSSRIGIREGKDLAYRFFVPDSPYVSKTR